MSAGRQRLDRLKWGHVRAWIATTAIIIVIVIIMVTVPQAQVSGPFSDERLATRIAADTRTINLRVGRSAVLDLESAITRVSLTTPEIADALVTSPNQVLIHGKTPGTISLFVWERMGAIRTYEVVVKRDLTALMGRMRQLFPGEPIAVADNGADVVISGTVSSKYIVEKAADVAAGYVESADHVVNLLRQQEGTASNQILLRVRFAEVNRSALQELGASFFTGILGHENYVGRVTTQQFPAPEFDNEEGLVFSDFLNLLVFNTQEQLGGVIRALQTRGLFQSLAEPNLIAQDGKEASFLAGGEFPFPVVQGSGGSNTAITIQFKEFGIRLSFTPTILMGDLIHLKVRPEVSALDFSNGLAIQGFQIPSLITRRADTEIELRDGQTFAIAGLLNSTVTETMSKIPGIGDIPILGLLFRSRARQKDRTELVVMITPHILRTGSIGVAPQLPDLAQPFLGPLDEPLPPPLPHVPQVSRFDRDASLFDGAIEQAVDGAAADGTLAGPVLTQPSALAARPVQTGTGASGNGMPDVNSEPFTPGDALRLDPDEAIRAAKERRRQEIAAEKLAREQGKRDAQAAEEAAKQAERDAKVAEKLAREQAKLDAAAAKQAAKEAERQQKAAAKQAAQDRKDAEKLAREQAKLDAAAAKQAAKEAKQAERDAKVAEKLAREQAKLDAAAAKQAAQEAERQQKAAAKQAAQDRKDAEKLAREQAKLDAAAAKQAAQEAEREQKAAAKQAAQDRKDAEKLAREQAKLDAAAAKQAERQQKAAAKQAAQDRKDAEKLAREQAKLDAAAAKQAAQDRKAADKLAREQAKWDAAAAKQAAQEAERQQKAAAKQAAQDRKAADKLAREQAKWDAAAVKQAAQEAERQQKAAAKQAAQDRKDAEQLAREQAKLDAAAAKQAVKDAEEKWRITRVLAAKRVMREVRVAAVEYDSPSPSEASDVAAGAGSKDIRRAQAAALELAKAEAKLEAANEAYEHELQQIKALNEALASQQVQDAEQGDEEVVGLVFVPRDDRAKDSSGPGDDCDDTRP